MVWTSPRLRPLESQVKNGESTLAFPERPSVYTCQAI